MSEANKARSTRQSEKNRLTLYCATDHSLETSCPHAYKVAHTEDFGRVAFTIEALPDCPIHLTKHMVYHTSQTASAEELCGRAEWTTDRVMTQGFQQLLASQEQYLGDFWRRSDIRVRDVREERTKRSTARLSLEGHRLATIASPGAARRPANGRSRADSAVRLRRCFRREYRPERNNLV
jgi:trehalose/maltose hydrolase-like predicted phosphorylase